MKIYDTLDEAQRIIGQHWKEGQSPEQEQVLEFARDALFFISSTGQPYLFEDYRKQPQAESPSRASVPTSTAELVRRTEGFFEQLLHGLQPGEERELTLVIIDALRFIASTGQLADFESYLQELDAHEPPRVVASFDTREQAERWLKSHPSPPHCAHILIAGRYHTVAYERATNGRYLPASRALEYYLASLEEGSAPAAGASFETREEADAWLRAQSAPPKRAWVLISGETYLAIYHPHINYRALYPLSMADGYVINTEMEPEGSPRGRSQPS
ncbi:hypothetical protein [Archangium sp.]|uniref:hypothetical protein n=1 Tax=Archangium sp. TaxID=1872627 RepID=UPI00286B4949|nr:hypothetical protein [Archangium sp.]